MKKSLLFILAFIVSAVSAWADAPFRNQRYDVFKVLPVTEQSIVFMGNSITNMHDWFEAFDNPNVINRGCSGAVSSELIDNLESVLPGHPKKIFLMIGTNDLGSNGLNTAAQVAAKVRTALNKCKKESPNTELYVQSILPSKSGIRTLEVEKESNDSIKKICGEYGATYVDLFDDLMDITTGALSADYLHLKASGYRIWCKRIEQYVGSKCVYEDSYTDINGNIGGVHGMRCTYFGMSPVKADDVLLIGDATVNCGEWNELLGTANVKKRSTGWGGQGIAIGTMQSMLSAIFEGNGNKVAPKKILIELGYNEAAGKTDADAAIATYKTFLEQVKAKAPNTPIVLLAVYPSNTASINTTYIVPFNEKLKALAEATDNVTYEEGTYTELVKNGVANTDYFSGAFLYGKGYVKMAQVIAKHVDNAKAITDEEAAARITTFNARTSLAKAIQTAEAIGIGNGVGQYKEEKAGQLTQAIEEGYALLTKDGATDSELSAKATTYSSAIQSILPAINLPEASEEDGEAHWYQLSTPNRGNLYTSSTGVGKTVYGLAYSAMAKTMWKFVKREDGTFDIVNRNDNSYISPVADYNKAIQTTAERPSKGWTLTYANVPGVFNISCGTVELNQTGSAQQYAIYNWSKNNTGKDKDDTGCQFCISVAPAPVFLINPQEVEISLETGAYDNPSATYNKNWTSTSTDPQIKLTCAANNMSKDGTNIVIASGSKKAADYVISAGDKYYVTGIRFKYVNASGNTSNITISCAGTSGKTSTTEQEINVTGLEASTVTLSLSGDNAGVVLKDFYVTLSTLSDKPAGDVTGIAHATTAGSKKNQAIYDLQGRRVKNMSKGIYIVGGKKVMVK